MQRLQPIDPATAEGKAKTLLDGAQKKFGMVPAIMQTMASSPAVLDAYLGFVDHGPFPKGSAEIDSVLYFRDVPYRWLPLIKEKVRGLA